MLASNLIKFDRFIFKIQLWVCLPLIVAMCVVTFLQVFTRYVLNDPLYWSEELSRYIFVWLTFLGIGIAAHRRSEMSVSFFVNLAPKRTQLLIEIIVTILVTAFLGIAIIEGFTLAIESYDLPSIALEIPWTYIYMSVPVGLSLLILQYISRLTALFLKLFSSTDLDDNDQCRGNRVEGER
jgi:TRAP-type C4-dicarboxylate transport system permease small subunit